MDTRSAMNELLDWFREGSALSFNKNEVIIRPEDTPRHIYLMENGSAKVYSLTRQGDENIRVFKKSGDVFPLIWTTSPMRRNSYYEAVEKVTVYRRSLEDLVEYLHEHSDASMALLDEFAKMYMHYADRINNLEFRYARERIAYRLSTLAETFGVVTDCGMDIDLPIRQRELADTVNVTRETASRELRRLKKKKIIDYKDGRYTILDMDALTKEFD